MGFDLVWIRKPSEEETKKLRSWERYVDADEPKSFDPRYVGRNAWLNTMWDCETDSFYYCGCCWENEDGTIHYGMMCPDPSASRPKDFNEFRKKLKERGLWHKPFRAFTRWLERHPDVYVTFSN